MKYFSKNLILPFFIILISALVVFWEFPRLPLNLAFDELEFAKLALSLEGKFIFFSQQATGHATPYFYLLLGSMKLFGINAFALRFPAAILGVLNSLFVYLVLRHSFKKREAFLGAIVFATLHWVFQFARFAFEATYLLFWELIAIWSLLNYLKNHKGLYFVTLLLGSVFSFYSYLPGRIFFLLPLLALILNRVRFKLILFYLVSFLVLTLPLLISTGTAENRVRELTYLSARISLSKKGGYFAENVLKNILMFNVKGDLNGRHNYPGKSALNPFLGVLFLAGLCLARYTKNKWLFCLWGMLSVAGTLFTFPIENPHFLRTYTLTVPIVFFITSAINWLLSHRKRFQIVLFILIILSSIYEIRTYFKYQRKVFVKAFEKKATDLNKLQFIDN